jgi:hypothetical protein
MRGSLEYRVDILFDTGIDYANFATQDPGNKLMDQKFRLTPPFAITVHIGVVPVSLLHNLPVDLIQLREGIKKAADCHLGMSISKEIDEPITNNSLDFKNEMYNGSLSPIIPANRTSVNRIQHRGTRGKVEGDIIRQGALGSQGHPLASTSLFDVIMGDADCSERAFLPAVVTT